MSYWQHRRPVQRNRAVDVESIARSSAEILDTRGERGLTIRAVAGDLGVAPASLYSRLRSAEDLADLALDHTLGADAALQALMASMAADPGPLEDLMAEYHRHLVDHPWACRVIAARPPRGPQYLELSERMCAALEDRGHPDPLGAAYALANYTIGCALTSAMAPLERAEDIDADIAPRYAARHAAHPVDARAIHRAGIAALLSG